MTDTKQVTSPNGNDHRLHYREGTSDLSVIGGTWRLWGTSSGEYHLADLPELHGTAVDIGAHIGAVSLALLADHPGLHVIAVEPLAENCEVMRLSADENGWSDRLTIVCGGIAKGKTTKIPWNFQGPEYIVNNRYIGGLGEGTLGAHEIVTVPAVSLTALIPDGAAYLKIDCEGCEWIALRDRAIAKVDRIAGEYHGFPGPDGLHKYLDKTHDLVIETNGATGLFWATRR